MRLPGLSAVLLTLTLPLFAEQPDRSGWEYDAVMPGHLPETAPAAADINAISDLLAKMLKCWNAHDLTGYLSVLWNSPQVMIVLDSEQFQGWDAVNTAYREGFSDPNRMGKVQPLRTQIRITSPGLALVQDEWIVDYPSQNNKQVIGSSTMSLQKLDGTWKVISSYSRFSPATSRGWEYDSIAPERAATTPSSEQADLKAISSALTNMDDRWNAHDIDGFMSIFWKSTQLLVVVQAEQFQGWETLYDTYKRGYPDPNAMGTIEPSRVQIKLVKPDFAIAVNWWTVSYSNSKVRVVGNTTMDLQKLQDGWKIVMAHSTVAEP
jgi:uncharacterized protein (TIGR02246 family)